MNFKKEENKVSQDFMHVDGEGVANRKKVFVIIGGLVVVYLLWKYK